MISLHEKLRGFVSPVIASKAKQSMQCKILVMQRLLQWYLLRNDGMKEFSFVSFVAKKAFIYFDKEFNFNFFVNILSSFKTIKIKFVA